MAEDKLRVAVLAGGDSSEKGISMKSARGIINMLDEEKYEVVKIVVSATDWTIEGGPYNGLAINRNDFSFVYQERYYYFDFAFIAIHGDPGENGILQGFFESLRVPYSTSNVLTSALSFNKKMCNTFLNEYGIRTPRSMVIEKGVQYNRRMIIEKFGLPLFVKPNEGGSSFGISKVKRADEFDEALNEAFKENRIALVEEFIDGMELTCGALKTKEKEFIFPLTEIVSKNEFFDYQAKYNEKYADEITPARIPESVESDIKYMTSRIYDILECRGIIRADYIWKGDNIYFLEMNTVPGMTERSLIPQQIEAMGIEPKEMLSMVIEDNINKMAKDHPHE